MRIAPPSLARCGLLGGMWLAVALAGALRAQDDSFVPRATRAPIYFPPFPPALDQVVNRHVPVATNLAAPPELAEFTSEIFYPQLSSHFAARTLNPRMTRAIADYRAARRALATELQQLLTATRDEEPATRRPKLQALARQQAARLTALEKSAEQLRAELIPADRNWSEFREWHLGDRDRRGFSPLEIGTVMRAFAHYEKSLLPQQRRLLREISLELAMAAETAEKASAAATFTFFSPDTARVIFPADAPPAVSAKIAAYLTKKSLLKKELYDAVYKADGKLSFFRGPLRDIADKQLKPLAELEALAEEIRFDLGSLATALPEPPRSSLPLVVTEKLNAHASQRVALQNEATAKVEAVVERTQRDQVPVRINYRFDDTGLKFVLVPMRGAAGSPQIDSVRIAMAAIAEEFGRAFAELVNRGLDLRQEISDLLGTREQRVVDAAAAVALRLAAQRADADAYRLYRTAVFEPGLSAEQRRLLFDVAIEALHLPLPRGEMQPMRRAGSW